MKNNSKYLIIRNIEIGYGKFSRNSLLLVVCRIFLLAFASTCISANSQTFQFVALGDLPYGEPEKIGVPYRALISSINELEPAFSIHIGDFKSGSTRCSNEEFQRQLEHFGMFETALFYTPGDNEWTDCHRTNNGAYDPLERLDTLRKMFYSGSGSLGKKPLAVEIQAIINPTFSRYVENQRWVYQNVVFSTLHIVGSNNNFEVRDAKAIAEFMERDQANIDWIKSTFSMAQKSGAKALVFAMQADVFEIKSIWDDFPTYSGFRTSIGDTLLPMAAKFNIPILLIHGDSHIFRFDQPFSLNKKPILNLTRLEVPGANNMMAVHVSVDTRAKHPWGVRIIEAQK